MKPSELLERPATPWRHHSVLLQEAVQALVHKPQGHYIDATFGRGGHSRAILACLAAEGRLTALDQDPEALGAAQAMPDLMADPRFAIHHCNFSLLAGGKAGGKTGGEAQAAWKDTPSSPDGTAFLAEMNFPKGGVDGLLLDLGISSPQIDQAERGLSFRLDGPLDMRMDTSCGTPVWQWLAQASMGSIAQVLRDFGQERFAAPIARAVVAQRESQGPLTRTLELAALVSRCIPRYEKGQHPATRTFQALRIFINQELEALDTVLQASLRLLQPQGRLVAISFHSLEDRRVKQFIAQHSRPTTDPRAPFLGPQDGLAALHLRALGRVKPSAEEVARNPRARSAVMRVAERTAQAL